MKEPNMFQIFTEDITITLNWFQIYQQNRWGLHYSSLHTV
jgi:hypothetical protein